MIGCKLSTRVVWTGAACQGGMEGGTGMFFPCEGPQLSSNISGFSKLHLVHRGK